MVWVGRDSINHLDPTPPPWAGMPSTRPEWLLKVPSNLALDTSHGRGSHFFSQQPVPVPHRPHSKEFLRYISSKSPLFQLKTSTPCPITPCPHQKSLSSFFVASLGTGRLLEDVLYTRTSVCCSAEDVSAAVLSLTLGKNTPALATLPLLPQNIWSREDQCFSGGKPTACRRHGSPRFSRA